MLQLLDYFSLIYGTLYCIICIENKTAAVCWGCRPNIPAQVIAAPTPRTTSVPQDKYTLFLRRKSRDHLLFSRFFRVRAYQIRKQQSPCRTDIRQNARIFQNIRTYRGLSEKSPWAFCRVYKRNKQSPSACRLTKTPSVLSYMTLCNHSFRQCKPICFNYWLWAAQYNAAHISS